MLNLNYKVEESQRKFNDVCKEDLIKGDGFSTKEVYGPVQNNFAVEERDQILLWIPHRQLEIYSQRAQQGVREWEITMSGYKILPFLIRQATVIRHHQGDDGEWETQGDGQGRWDTKGAMCCTVSSVVSNSLQPYWPQLTRLLCPWDSPGENTGVGYHALLQGVFPNIGIEFMSLMSPALAGELFTTSTTWEAQNFAQCGARTHDSGNLMLYQMS